MYHQKFCLAAAASAAETGSSKFAFLHKLLSGEASFQDNTPVRLSYVQQSFGENWHSELSEWANTNLDKKAQATLRRQMNRLSLTKYTNRELAEYLEDGGVRNLDLNAHATQIKDALEYFQVKGEAAFRSMVDREGKLSNWTQSMCADFIEKVMKAHSLTQKKKSR
ncbi:myotonin-protein kinase [Perkinsela sp. CCAP 1560/4]|nr:myotonin-protein kinase [Perkinsela sp. CCAP 1560/4]|eukprot:KNH07415.1 myotonin-protein kinase [Perkinsela sp. CCAP 1560/4]